MLLLTATHAPVRRPAGDAVARRSMDLHWIRQEPSPTRRRVPSLRSGGCDGVPRAVAHRGNLLKKLVGGAVPCHQPLSWWSYGVCAVSARSPPQRAGLTTPQPLRAVSARRRAGRCHTAAQACWPPACAPERVTSLRAAPPPPPLGLPCAAAVACACRGRGTWSTWHAPVPCAAVGLPAATHEPRRRRRAGPAGVADARCVCVAVRRARAGC